MTTPHYDFSQTGRLLAALHREGDQPFLAFYAEKMNGKRSPRAFRAERFTFHPDRLGELAAHLETQNAANAVAMTVAAFTGKASRVERNATSIGALALDIDEKDLARLDLDSGDVSSAADRVVSILESRRLKPHAVIGSGHGIHVYVLIEHVMLDSDRMRQRVKNAWWKLGAAVGGATDRFDLASVMRLPGSINRKNGAELPVRFIEQHTDLARSRYSLTDIEGALSDLAPPKAKQRSRSVVKENVALGTTGLRESAHLALALDSKLADLYCEAASGRDDRSKRDFQLACGLARLGLEADEVASAVLGSHKARGKNDPESYAFATSLNAISEVAAWKRPIETYACGIFDQARRAFYEVVEGKRLYPVEDTAAAASPQPQPQVGIVVARAGDGKTTSIIEALSTSPEPGGRVAVCSAFVGELLRHEYAINRTFPSGRFYDGGELDLQLPKSNDALTRLSGEWTAEGVLDCATWTLPQLNARVVDPAAFWINSVHPRRADQRITDEDLAPLFADRRGIPTAVTKFRGKVELCLAKNDQRALADPKTCKECTFTACRSNRNRGGSKTYWKQAPVALLTHRAFATQAIYSPPLNAFDAVIFDEVPSSVYRTPALHVRQRKKGKKSAWKVREIDLVRRELAECESTDEAIRDRLDRLLADVERREIKVAQTLATRVAEGVNRCSHERRVDRRAPIMTHRDFADLAKILGHLDTPEEEGDSREPDEEAGQAPLTLDQALSVLRDFSGDTDFPVWLEHTFTQATCGTLTITRAVNAWSELLLDHQGRVRRSVFLDATAGVDPRYLLLGEFAEEHVPGNEFPNTTLVLTSDKATSRTKFEKRGVDQAAAELVEQVLPHAPAGEWRLLVVTTKKQADAMRGALEAEIARRCAAFTVKVAHFGALRGRNDFEDFDAVYFTHLHRYNEAYYFGLCQLLEDRAWPKQWTSKNATEWLPNPVIVDRAMVCDLYQDAMRIGIRRDPNRQAHIFIPSSTAGIVTRLAKFFVGSKIVRANGTPIVVPSR